MDWNSYLDDMKGNLREMHKSAPETMKGFGALEKGVTSGTATDHKTKELVALGIAIGLRCEPCIGFHVKALAKAGGTREELCDILGVAVQMGGGPALMYASKTLAAWDQLVTEQA
ncbi:alkylhydroperoxidase AhpD family core domain-containing protein [Tropicimonas sediminicola]|uniref:Alkylhydroperoxidase AhpD family core domain-containing protein n=3 Tax=Tropicimonas TaxID=599652 RepID=A0A239LVQ0_9RHOB|nr:carboxymuconolactone decarboxylase family protein [Tropicimonas sediminicola]SNT34032.1 alkylhydroperoxidase AhpD family core domain-containing protein [Tropicimonas sediminicola]